MGLIDTHTHLESFARNGTLEAALAAAKVADVEAMITIGTSPEDWDLYRDLARAHAASGLVRYTVGLHPCSVDRGWERMLSGLEKYWSEQDGPRPVALGECGLDRFHLPKEAEAAAQLFEWQQAAFARQLEVARRLAVPIVVHSRGALPECVAMIDASGCDWRRVVFHCFTEGAAEIDVLRQRGGVGSFTGILTYKTAENIRAAARQQGIDHFMLETDAPYLTPMPHRGKPNEPAFVRHTAEFAAGTVFNVTMDELTAASTRNAQRFFGL